MIWKKVLIPLVLCTVTSGIFSNCSPATEKPTTDGEVVETPVPVDIDASSVDVLGETWRVTELTFESNKEYNTKNAEQFDVVMDAKFTNKNSGTTLTIPAFWDGENIFRVRFAPTQYGIWEYETFCDTDASLNGRTGTIGANIYKGDLDIYKHGFVKTNGSKYFVYDDGTPFFYLGDTHWTMLTEEFDKPGPHAGNTGASSHFKYIVDKRVSQGFTVYQSEPIGARFILNDGFQSADIRGFQQADQYFDYIAQAGLVHANAQFFFPNTMSDELCMDVIYLEKLARYWVARWGAYPVMWTLAQEIDNNDLHNYTFNPWVNIAEYLHKYDAYGHPLTGHQINTGITTVTGKGCQWGPGKPGKGRSLFASSEVTERTGHNWYAAQWSQKVNEMTNSDTVRDYWDSPKVGVAYEMNYCNLWTDDFGARVQGWRAYLNGLFGYGYGAIDIWYYNSSYDIEEDSVKRDGRSTITVADKKKKWSEAVEFESGYQMGYMRSFFESFDWWELVPDFNNEISFIRENEEVLYDCAAKGNEIYVIYLFSESSVKTGIIGNVDSEASYTIQWFNPRTGEFLQKTENVKTDTLDKDGKPGISLSEKPDTTDWVVLVTKN